jgi:hypothetical protein
MDKHNPYHPSIYNIGYIGVGVYKTGSEGKMTKIYESWVRTFKRCYDIKTQQNQPTYIDCSIHSDWHNFQNFAKWYEYNYVEGFALDKDILVKGNKIYSHETCCFVPSQINLLFTKCNRARGKYPIGVSYHKGKNKFISSVSKHKQVHLGYFNTPEEAFEAYKIAKEAWIKELANKYKDQITEACYQALINYKIEITD